MITQELRCRGKNKLRFLLKCDIENFWSEQKNHRLEVLDKESNVKYSFPLPNRFWAILFWHEFDYLLDQCSEIKEDDVIDCVVNIATKLDKMSDSDPPHILHRISASI